VRLALRLTATLQGFASTVWDSSIVLSKYLERRFGAGAGALAGRRAVELGAGCGLVSCVLARLGADVTATDMEGNLPLLRDNLAANRVRPQIRLPHDMRKASDSFPRAVPAEGTAGVRVAPLLWGAEAARRVASAVPDDANCIRRAAAAPGSHGFDLVVATDVMYVHEAVPALLAALRALSEAPGAEVLLAHGRNRPAEAAFLEAAALHFSVQEVPEAELHDIYRCIDVTVLRLTPRRDEQAPRDA
jgi:predicted nicotinamide N-methyase